MDDTAYIVVEVVGIDFCKVNQIFAVNYHVLLLLLLMKG